jgi:hypothetical protein
MSAAATLQHRKEPAMTSNALRHIAARVTISALATVPLAVRVRGGETSVAALICHILSGIMPRLSQQIRSAARLRTAFLCAMRILEHTNSVTCVTYIAYAAALACAAEFICCALGYTPAHG